MEGCGCVHRCCASQSLLSLFLSVFYRLLRYSSRIEPKQVSQMISLLGIMSMHKLADGSSCLRWMCLGACLCKQPQARLCMCLLWNRYMSLRIRTSTYKSNPSAATQVAIGMGAGASVLELMRQNQCRIKSRCRREPDTQT